MHRHRLHAQLLAMCRHVCAAWGNARVNTTDVTQGKQCRLGTVEGTSAAGKRKGTQKASGNTERQLKGQTGSQSHRDRDRTPHR